MEMTSISNTQRTADLEGDELWVDLLDEKIITNCENDIFYCIAIPKGESSQINSIPETPAVDPVFHTQAFDLHWHRELRKAGLKETLWV